MAWGTKTQIATTLTGSTVEVFSSAVTLTPGELLHVEVEFNPVGTPTDDLLVRLYGTLDDATENWDDTPIYEFAIANSPDPNKASFIVSGLYRFRLGFIRDGTTDAISVDAFYRADNVNL